MMAERLDALATQQGLFVMGAALLSSGGTRVLLGLDTDGFRVFQSAAEFTDGLRDPLDRWSRRVITGIAKELNAVAKFPFGGPPHEPFIAWATETGRFHQSPVGMLVHDRAGLLISIRGALELPVVLNQQASGGSPCDGCGQPCVTACPVDALKGAVYDVEACKADLDRAENDCMALGCAARRACPVSQRFGRTDQQSAFHMRAFR